MTTYRSAWLDDDLDALRELARSFFAKELTPNIDKFIEQHHVDREFWNKAGALGLLCASIPEEYGGGGGTFAHEAVLIEEQAKAFDTSWGPRCTAASSRITCCTTAPKSRSGNGCRRWPAARSSARSP